MIDKNQSQVMLEYVQNLVNELLEFVDHNEETGPLIDELVGVAIPNLRLELDLPASDGQ